MPSELQSTDATTIHTSPIAGTARRALNTLTRDQQGDALNFHMALKLEFKVGVHEAGDFVKPGRWFFDLLKREQQQIIDYFASHVFKRTSQYAVVLTWYESTQRFRYEKTIIPA